MLSQINRVKKKKDFELIFKSAKSFKNNLFILKVGKNTLNINRVGFVVSKKISQKAVVRNKVRRRLAESIKKEIDNIDKGTDLIFIALVGIEKKEFLEIKEGVLNILVKARLINKSNV